MITILGTHRQTERGSYRGGAHLKIWYQAKQRLFSSVIEMKMTENWDWFRRWPNIFFFVSCIWWKCSRQQCLSFEVGTTSVWASMCVSVCVSVSQFLFMCFICPPPHVRAFCSSLFPVRVFGLNPLLLVCFVHPSSYSCISFVPHCSIISVHHPLFMHFC